MIYAGISLYTQQFNGMYLFYFLLVAATFFIIGVLISYLSYKNKHFSLVKIVVCIAVFCFIDQGIKLCIVNNLDISIVIIKDLLAIKVAQNTHGSFITSLFDKKLPDLFTLTAILALYIVYRALYFYQKNGDISLYLLSFILMCAGFICVFFDKAIYGGTYDYIFLYQRIYFDLKDCYMASSIFTMLLSCIYDKNWSKIKEEIRFDPWSLMYYRYEVDTWRSIIAKFTKGNQKNK
jgi:lipoprotein signal peptidase